MRLSSLGMGVSKAAGEAAALAERRSVQSHRGDTLPRNPQRASDIRRAKSILPTA